MTVEDAPLHQRSGELHNIGPRERRARLGAGIVLLVVGLMLVVALATSSTADWWWAPVLFVIYYQGTRFVLDYRTGTCPLLSELGQRRAPSLPMLSEPVLDASLASRIRAVSRRALIEAAVVALGLTILSQIVILLAEA